MPNVFHKNYTLDNNHALHARVYADFTAMEDDTAFNADSANVGKAILVNSPASVYTLLTTAPLFLEFSNTTAGDVTTSDTLVSEQLLLGNGGKDIVTEADLTYDGTVLSVAANVDIAASKSLTMDGVVVLSESTGVTLNNIALLDSTTKETIENAIVQLDNLEFAGFTSNSITGPSGAWQNSGFNAGPGDMFSINSVPVIDAAGVITLKNIAALDATTTATIAAVVGNVTTSDTLTATQLLLGNGTVDIVTEPKITFDGTSLVLDNGGTFIPPVEYSNNLVIKEDDNSGITIFSGNSQVGHIIFGDTESNTRGLLTYEHQTDEMSFYTLGMKRLTIDSIGMVGVRIQDPISPLHVYENTTSTAMSAGITIEQDGIGDAMLQFLLTGEERWIVGIDNSDDDKFKINENTTFQTNGAITILSTSEFVGLGTNNPGTRLHIASSAADTTAVMTKEVAGTNGAGVREFVGDRDPEGNITGNPGDSYHRVSGTGSGVFIFKGASAGTAGWVEVITGSGTGNVSTSDTLTATQLLLGNGGTEIVTESQLTFDGTSLTLDNGGTFPAPQLYGNNLVIKENDHNGITILTPNDSNAHLIFGDTDDSDRGKIQYTHPTDTLSFATSNVMHMWIDSVGMVGLGIADPLSRLHVSSPDADTTAIVTIESAGTNGASVREFVGDRSPEGNVTGSGPDVYYSNVGDLSGTYESRSATPDTVWLKRSVLPSNIIELLNSSELDDLASGGIITIAANTTWHVRGALVTANRIVVNAGIFFRMTGEFNATASITYSGTDTFITAPGGNVQIYGTLALNSSSTGTFYEGTLSSSVLVIAQSSLAFWTDLGSLTDGRMFASNSAAFSCASGFTLTNTIQVNLLTFNQVGAPLNGPFFTINTNNPDSIYTVTDIAGFNLGTGSLFDINTLVHPDVTMNISRCSAPGAEIFKQSILADATINSVADGVAGTGTITAMADNGSGGTTISSTTSYFENELTTITGTTNYNGTFQIFNMVPAVSFDIIAPFAGDDATGSFNSDRIIMSLAGGHGISPGDSIKVIDTNFYNGFYTVLGESLDDIVVNEVFVATDTGSIERDLSLDQTDPRVLGFLNRKTVPSHFIASAHVNDNSTAIGAIVNNTFTDMVFGTAGDALLSNSTMERWKLVDEINGTFEYIGIEGFDGNISFDFTVVSSGGTTDFRFKWMIDEGGGFADLPDPVEVLAAVGSDAESVTKTYPLRAVQGDQIKPQITRNSGSSSITSSYATIHASM